MIQNLNFLRTVVHCSSLVHAGNLKSSVCDTHSIHFTSIAFHKFCYAQVNIMKQRRSKLNTPILYELYATFLLSDTYKVCFILYLFLVCFFWEVHTRKWWQSCENSCCHTLTLFARLKINVSIYEPGQTETCSGRIVDHFGKINFSRSFISPLIRYLYMC